MAVIPPAPLMFDPELAPVGVEVRFVEFVDQRPPMKAEAFHFHTNGAGGEGTVDSAWNHTHAAPNQNTLPHYQLDRTHNGVTRCRKMLPTNLRGIGSTTVGPATKDSNGRLIWPTLTEDEHELILAHDNVREHTIVVETADTGSRADPTISAFDAGQLELGATILAYESIVHGFPLTYQTNWWDPGVASHTDPYGFPFTTIHRGKICPGLKKKAQVRDLILPRARQIVAAWTAPIPTPEVDDMKLYIAKDDGNPNLVMIGDGIHSRRVRAAQLDEVHAIIRAGRGPAYYNVLTEERVTDPADIPAVSADMLLVLGYELEESTP